MVGRLAFGPAGKASRWTAAVPFLRVLSLAARDRGVLSAILQVGSVSESVQVEASMVQVETMSAAMGAAVGGPVAQLVARHGSKILAGLGAGLVAGFRGIFHRRKDREPTEEKEADPREAKPAEVKQIAAKQTRGKSRR